MVPPKEVKKEEEPKRVVARRAFQVEEKNGGFQLFRLNLSKDYQVISREKVGDPDAWEQIISSLEAELSLQFS